MNLHNIPYKPDMNVNPDIENESFDYMIKDEEEPVKESPKFIIRARLLVLKKFIISKNQIGGFDFSLL